MPKGTGNRRWLFNALPHAAPTAPMGPLRLARALAPAPAVSA
jgi:hypothetical protein